MSKDNPMNYINSGDKIKQTRKLELLFNKAGQKLESPKEKVYGKIVAKDGSDYYYIRVHQSIPFDPFGTYAKREGFIETKMHQTTKSTFDFYMMYLNTKNTIYMTRARRGFTND